MLDQGLLPALQFVRRVEVFLLHGGHLFRPDICDLLFGSLDVRRQQLFRRFALLGRLGGVGLRLLVRLRSLLLRLLGLLEFVPILLDLRDLLVDLLGCVGGCLVQGQRSLRLMLLRPPLLEVHHLLRRCLHLAGVHPSHVCLDEFLGLFHVLDGLGDGLSKATARLELLGAFLHGAKEVLQGLEFLLVLRLAVPGLVHPILQIGRHLADLLSLLLRGHLDNVLPFEFVPAAVDSSLQFVLDARNSLDLGLVGSHPLQFLFQLLDLLLGERCWQEVLPRDLQFLLVLFLLQLLGDLGLWLDWLRGVVLVCGGVIGRRSVIGGGARRVRCLLHRGVGLLRGLFLRFVLRGPASAACVLRGRACGVARGVGLLGLRLRDVHPIRLLNGGHWCLKLNEATQLEGHRDRDLWLASHIVFLPLALQDFLQPSDGVLRDWGAILEDADEEILLEFEGQFLLAAKRSSFWIKHRVVFLPFPGQRGHLHRIVVLCDVREKDFLHSERAARVARHKSSSEGRRLLSVQMLAQG
mmetsp:Transcript_80946/g.203665  ORF Transcript_80946/g.203665 Transcript_80946/m.203665 type:complete len:523 (+) Transcript_80946:134-1702(+)